MKNAFAPDGVCVEGIGYWGYSNQFGGVLYESLSTAFGSDFGLSAGEGLSRSAVFADAILPNGTSDLEGFNFGDVGGISRWYAGNCAWYWHARRFGHAAFLDGDGAKQSRTSKSMAAGRPDWGVSQLHALSIVWFVPHEPRHEEQAPDSLFRGQVPIVTMRSSWTDPDATQLFCKGGDNSASHGHLDLGGFELIADGMKWAVDLGMDSYGLPGYFGTPEERGAIYRVSTRSHNTLTFGGQNQRHEGTAPVTAFASTPRFALAVIDLTRAYDSPKAKSILRGFLFDRKRVLVQDEFDLDEAAPSVRWAMVTKAEGAIGGPEITLLSGGKTLTLKILAPAGATFSEVSTRPGTSAENPNEGTRLVAVELANLPRGRHRLAVLICPGDSAGLPSPAMKPLTDWAAAYPVD